MLSNFSTIYACYAPRECPIMLLVRKKKKQLCCFVLHNKQPNFAGIIASVMDVSLTRCYQAVYYLRERAAVRLLSCGVRVGDLKISLSCSPDYFSRPRCLFV